MTVLARRALWAVTAGSLVTLATLALVVAPPDRVQGDAQRLMYLHVPAAWIAYVAFAVTSLTSALYLWRRTRHPRWDRVAASSAERGARRVRRRPRRALLRGLVAHAAPAADCPEP